MGIDIERLKTDAAYWDECGAPEWATMFGLVGVRKLPVWFNLQEYQHASGGHSNRAFDFFNDGTYSLYQISGEIPRPAKPAATEWSGEGLPPVGLECEVQVQAGEPWYVVEIIAHYDGSAVFIAGDDYPHGVYDGCSHPENFRPIRTKEQRQRDELEYLIESAYATNGVKGVADAMESSYNLEPKDA